MLNPKSYSGITRLVVAFDIGTTYSRVSYGILEHGQVPGVSGVMRFPSAHAEVPSVLYYDKNGTVKATGHEVLTEDISKTASAEGWTKAECWKLHLLPRHCLDDDLHPLPPKKSVVDVLTDFIKYLFRCTKTYIQEHHPTFSCSCAEHSIEYILTYPGSSGVQQGPYRRAIEYAGLVPSTLEGQSRVHMLTECEAILYHYVAPFLKPEAANKPAPQGIVVIDAGGGTIKLTTFSVTFNPLSWVEIAPAECRAQGSLFVTRRAGALLERKLKGWEHSNAKAMVRFTREFDQTTKLVIKSKRKPVYVEVGGLRTNDVKYCISFGKLMLPGEEVTGLIDDSIDAIIDAFERQQRTTTMPITTAFLVGGFAKNDWLWSRLQSYFKGMNIEICRPDCHINEAVVNGAVLSRVAFSMPDIRPTTMGHIVRALTLAGKGELEEAMQVFDFVFWSWNPNQSSLLLLIKAIIIYIAGKCDNAISRIHDLIRISGDDETTSSCFQVLGKMYLMQGDYKGALESLERGRSLASSYVDCHLETISIIFGWTFDGLQVMAQLRHCEALLAAGCGKDAAEVLLKTHDIFGNEMDEVTKKRVIGLEKDCVDGLERRGDAALGSGKPEEATACYSSALSLKPPNPIDILVKRSKARALQELWKDALTDADEVIRLDSSSRQGYERKCMALHGLKKYVEAKDALLRMISIIKQSPDEETRRLQENYIDPREAIDTIETAAREIFRLCPLVLIDLTTGRLCDEHERIQLFKSGTQFQKLVLEIAIMKLDYSLVRQAVAKYFQWTMFSHTWEGREPTFQDVNIVDSVWSLGESPLNEKLRQFCTTSREDGHRWAWSDTCCIDKTTSSILSQSLTSMYRWYEEAAETLVYLADVLSSAEPGALMRSLWMTRAWTLQELLASKVVRFYTRDWKLYLNDKHANHKESPQIKHELAQALGVSPKTITSFRPEDLGVREKLRLASTRNATMEEDIAYSLIGIFSSNIRPQYGLGEAALGELLENILDRTGDVTILAWTGISSPYNSILPDSLAAYRQVPHNPPPMEDDELDACITRLRSEMEAPGDALAFHHRVIQLPRATFSNRCLQLPCVSFFVKRIGVQEMDGDRGHLYRAMVSLLGTVEFRTMDAMPLQAPQRLVFVHPWLHDLRDPLDEFLLDDEDDVEPVVGWDNEDAEFNAGFGDGNEDSDVFPLTTPLLTEPSIQVDRHRQALRLIARLGRPFNALLLERQNNGRYRRVATEYEIIVPGVPYRADLRAIRAKMLEVV